MGALLSLILASESDISGVASISAPIGVKNKLFYLSPMLKHLVKDIKWGSKRQNEFDQGYAGFPAQSILELGKVIKKARSILGKVKCPLLVVQSKKDQLVAKRSMEALMERAGSERIEKLWLFDSAHACTVGPEKDILNKTVMDFLNRSFSK